MEKIPLNVHPMDVMRTITSFLGLIEPENKHNDQIKISIRLLGILLLNVFFKIYLLALYGPALMYWYHYVHSGLRIVENTYPKDTIA